MLVNAIEGTTRRLGKQQGYLGLPVLDCVDENGQPMMISSWQPTPDELTRLKLGAPIYLWVYGTMHPPVIISVADVADPDIKNPYPPKEPENA
jgi:hypothetical protein